MEVRSRIAGRYKETLAENAAVIISALAVLIAALSLLFGGVSIFMAFSADQEAAVNSIYIQRLDAELRAQGFEPPPLPEEQ